MIRQADQTPPSKAREDTPMTALQIAELRGLADRAGEPFAPTLTRREARERILALRSRLQVCLDFP